MTVAAVGSLFFLVTLATLSLVTLRRGALEGTWIIAAAMIFAVAFYLISGTHDPLSITVTLASCVVVYLSAIVLRMTVSWSQTLAVLIVSSSIISVVVAWLTSGVVSQVEQVLIEQSAQMPGLVDYINRPALIVSMLVPSGVCGLLLGRWWQALVYNPGGFKQDFYELRLSAQSTLVYGIAAAVFLYLGKHYVLWAAIVMLPLLMVASAVVHHWVSGHKNSLVLWIYYFLLTFPPILVLVVLVGFLDHWLDFRSRLNRDN